MSSELDRLLASDLLDVPDDFTARVMQNLPSQQPVALKNPIPHPRWRAWRWAAYWSGGALGFIQLISFMFGIWTATAAG